MLSTYQSYKIINSDMTRSLDRIASEPINKRATDYYLANIEKVKSIDDFLKDDKLFSYAMKAFGLSDMTYAKGMMKKVLQEGVESTSSLANRLADPRYKAFATAFNFARYGYLTTTFAATQSETVAKYNQQTLEESAGQDNAGVRLALYFKRSAGNITSSYSILADAALLKVVQTALNLPSAMSAADIDAQAKEIDKRLKVADLQDPKKLDKFLQRFTSMYDLQNTDPTTTSPILAAFTGQSSQIGIGTDLMMKLQTLKLGR
ncbi:DUF1217 domain-containing protein [Methylocella sp. CPCC 101449]|jgi:hypothetical protein|uniref:DUF1217 domain-containing protein n=1 Tax=Methylocella sp. CPCC 101449 TaxID=2987531 RepID=UPI00288CDE76|nr:DUF1217 domain-containing protein [Methylocella sp. CPCC 101449]MDT2021162.1 DUF1217 domain-containing protein [Methylocella sp. CPCC 101449]HEV2572390.1 DUF1217 domain-containing protein [Beijerinckiaceae bacterium]